MMRVVVLFSTIAVFLTFVGLLGHAGKRIDLMQHRFAQLQETERYYSDDELKKSFSERVFRPAVNQLTNLIKRSAGKRKTVGSSKANQKLQAQISASGLQVTLQEFTFIKSMLTLLFLMGGVFFFLLAPIEMMYRLLILLILVCIPVYGSSFFLRSRVKARKQSIAYDLPDVMDVLVVSLEAGLGLDSAIIRQYSKNKNTVLTELNNAIKEVQMGVPRRTALKEMAERCDVKELTVFVTALLQADQLGTSVKNVLQVQSERLRIERKQAIQAKAAKAPIKIMLPTVLFIFPVVFIILLGPAAVDIIATFGS